MPRAHLAAWALLYICKLSLCIAGGDRRKALQLISFRRHRSLVAVCHGFLTPDSEGLSSVSANKRRMVRAMSSHRLARHSEACRQQPYRKTALEYLCSGQGLKQISWAPGLVDVWAVTRLFGSSELRNSRDTCGHRRGVKSRCRADICDGSGLARVLCHIVLMAQEASADPCVWHVRFAITI